MAYSLHWYRLILQTVLLITTMRRRVSKGTRKTAPTVTYDNIAPGKPTQQQKQEDSLARWSQRLKFGLRLFLGLNLCALCALWFVDLFIALYRSPSSEQTIKDLWLESSYRLNEETLDPLVRPLWLPLDLDTETVQYLSHTRPIPLYAHWLRKQLALHFTFSQWDAQAIVGGNPLHVLTSAHIDKLLGPKRQGKEEFRILDVGAGDGHVTQHFSVRFHHITCMESSYWTRRLLKKRRRPNGESLCNEVIDKLPDRAEQFDVISMLNVLDRIHEPASLLAKVKSLLKKDGRLILAQVHGYRPTVARASGGWEKPREAFLPLLRDQGEPKREKEDEVSLWVTKVLRPHGWLVQSVSCVPYLAPRHAFAPKKFSKIVDLIFVAKPEQHAEWTAIDA